MSKNELMTGVGALISKLRNELLQIHLSYKNLNFTYRNINPIINNKP